LRELAHSPLLLNVLSVAYHATPAADIAQDAGGRAALFEHYIARMFEHRADKTTPFPRAKVLAWLGWLAGRMQERSQSVFYLEGLQPDWLSGKWRYGFYFGLFFGLLFGLLDGLLSGLLGEEYRTRRRIALVVGAIPPGVVEKGTAWRAASRAVLWFARSRAG
jgi:hypothetical protein